MNRRETVPRMATGTISKRVSRSTPAQVPETNPVKKFMLKKAAGERSMRLAINAMCSHCMGCTASEQGERFEDWREPGFVQLVRDCTAPHCPLFGFRPYQTNGK